MAHVGDTEMDDPSGSVPGQCARLGGGSRFPAAVSEDDQLRLGLQYSDVASMEHHRRARALQWRDGNARYVANVSRNLLQTIPFDYGVFKNLPDGTPPSASAANINARQPFPDYGPTSLRVETTGVIDYHSLQASSNVRRGDLMAASPTCMRMTSAMAAAEHRCSG